eukprot:TRINITY_DN606_c0_g2_i1.p1 TRINITY_DN606_c0_g2~~TRINITY_DN606_c0_g2_i1.p1  ORF type:complete len:1022 (-),score=285.43 TRINITY_DN606_c0_g2_i1:135-3020(-)
MNGKDHKELDKTEKHTSDAPKDDKKANVSEPSAKDVSKKTNPPSTGDEKKDPTPDKSKTDSGVGRKDEKKPAWKSERDSTVTGLDGDKTTKHTDEGEEEKKTKGETKGGAPAAMSPHAKEPRAGKGPLQRRPPPPPPREAFKRTQSEVHRTRTTTPSSSSHHEHSQSTVPGASPPPPSPSPSPSLPQSSSSSSSSASAPTTPTVAIGLEPLAKPSAPSEEEIGDPMKLGFYGKLCKFRSGTVRTSMFDPSVASLLVPCYNEKEESDQTLSSIEDELYYLSQVSVKGVPLKEMNIMFVVDGSGVDQLETALEIIVGYSKRLHASERHPALLKNGGRKVGEVEWKTDVEPIPCTLASIELTHLIDVQDKISECQKKLSKLTGLSYDRKDVEVEITKLKVEKDEIFERHNPETNPRNGRGFMLMETKDYSTTLLQYYYELEVHSWSNQDRELVTAEIQENMTKGDAESASCIPSAEEIDDRIRRSLRVRFCVFVKKDNRQKRDTLLFSVFTSLKMPKIPYVQSFVDCDTSWKPRSLTRMIEQVLRYDHVSGVSGTIQVGNPSASYGAPVTSMQDFAYTMSQCGAKEAENLVGMVTCMPGAFSAIRLEHATEGSILNDLSDHPKDIWAKNRLELGEDRWWTTLILKQNLNGKDLGRRNIRHLTTAVGSTIVPEDIITYTLQQRRWINSTFSNFVTGLIPVLSKQCGTCRGWNFFLGTLYLYVRTLLEHMGFFLSPAIVSLFILAMLIDIGVAPTPATYITLALMFFAVFVVFLYPKPKEYPWPYRLFYIVSTLGMFGLTIMWLIKVTSVLIDIGSADTMTVIRVILVFLYFFIIIVLGILHKKLRRMLWLPIKPLYMIAFAPYLYGMLIIYSLKNFDDMSWGNRDSQADQSEDERKKAETFAKHFFAVFIIMNLVVFTVCRIADDSEQQFIFLFLISYLLITMLSTFILSVISALLRLIGLRPQN